MKKKKKKKSYHWLNVEWQKREREPIQKRFLFILDICRRGARGGGTKKKKSWICYFRSWIKRTSMWRRMNKKHQQQSTIIYSHRLFFLLLFVFSLLYVKRNFYLINFFLLNITFLFWVRHHHHHHRSHSINMNFNINLNQFKIIFRSCSMFINFSYSSFLFIVF